RPMIGASLAPRTALKSTALIPIPAAVYDDFHASGRIQYMLGLMFTSTVRSPFFRPDIWNLRYLAAKYNFAKSDNKHSIIPSSP
ncbi:hypothetical protein EC988_006531, partial [Linderina pennispora]